MENPIKIDDLEVALFFGNTVVFSIGFPFLWNDDMGCCSRDFIKEQDIHFIGDHSGVMGFPIVNESIFRGIPLFFWKHRLV